MTLTVESVLRTSGEALAAPPTDVVPRASAPAGQWPGNAALALQGIDLSFGGVAALRNVELVVGRGEIRSIIGPNGAGKSSLLNVITGIYRPDRGRIRFVGREFRQVPTSRLAMLGVARTFQNLALFKGLSVLDNVVMGRAAVRHASFVEQVAGLGRARREDRDALARAEQILDVLDLRSLRARPVATLPYGVQKRVELARALVAEPGLLLLDEPMAGMTSTEKVDMARLIREARDRFKATVLLIEHDIDVVMSLSDRISVLDHGRVIADGTPHAVQADPAVIDAYLGVAHDNEREAA